MLARELIVVAPSYSFSSLADWQLVLLQSCLIAANGERAVQKSIMHVSGFLALAKFRHLSGFTGDEMPTALFNFSRGSGVHSP